MKNYKNIIVGLDLTTDGDAVTPGACKAAHQAIWVAKANDGSIRFVHSSRPDGTRTPGWGSSGVVHEGLPSAGRAALEALVTEVQESGVKAELVITDDRPWIDIIKLVLKGGVDLVIVGKRNEATEDGRRLGSIAVKLLRKCPGPVWVVRPEHDLVHKLVLAATDLTEVGDQAVCEASAVAGRHGCKFHVVHAWQMPLSMQMESSRMSEEEFNAEVEQAKEQVKVHIEKCLPDGSGPKMEIHTGQGSPAQIIQEAVDHLHPDLLVMGTVSRTGIAGLLIGSTAERMLAQVDCSILTLKPDGFESPVKL
ncbi:MAG: universal stress protein E [Planctomycetota bacterium]|jgi:universal stress protein E